MPKIMQYLFLNFFKKTFSNLGIDKTKIDVYIGSSRSLPFQRRFAFLTNKINLINRLYLRRRRL